MKISEPLSEKSSITEETLSKEMIAEVVKNAHKDASGEIKSKMETEEKIYNLGFMPVNEINGLVVNELGKTFDLDRVKKLWLPKSQKANELINTDMQLLDEEKMKDVVRDIDPQYSNKIEEIEKKLQQVPFWKANKHSIKMVKIDELICLQNNVNTDRATNHMKRLSKNPTTEELLDYCFDFNRKTADIHSHMIANNAILFSTDDHDVRSGKIEVRMIERFAENDLNDKVPTLVIPITQGDPFVYCVRTYMPMGMLDGTSKIIYFMTLQNGIHRAYALKSLGIEYMPCIIIDPISAEETKMLMTNWTPERMQQNATQRPPLMKDFFNPDLTEKFNVRKRLMCVRVEWKIEKFTT